VILISDTSEITNKASVISISKSNSTSHKPKDNPNDSLLGYSEDNLSSNDSDKCSSEDLSIKNKKTTVRY